MAQGSTQPTPLMPHATATWLVDNTALSFEQIAAFCGLHILEVQAMADDPQTVGSQRLNRWIYQGTPLADQVLGTEASVSSLAPEDLRAFIKCSVGPQNTILVLVGEFDPHDVEDAVRRHFECWQVLAETATRKGVFRCRSCSDLDSIWKLNPKP